MKSLEDFPDWIRSVAARVAGTRFAALDFAAETGSTNADLLALAASGAGEMVRVADHQTAGRGRLDRQWQAPAGANLLVSVLVRPTAPTERWPLLTTAMALAVVDTVTALVPSRADAVAVRWPNDVMVADPGGGERKLAGVLAEVASGPAGPLAAVVGVGLNVGWPAGPADVPELAATSLVQLGAAPDRAAVLASLLLRFAHWAGAVERDPAALAAANRAASGTIGRAVRVSRSDGTVIEGRAVDIDDSGRVVVEHAGVRDALLSADVVHLR